MSCDESILSLNDVLRNLEEIEDKYEPQRGSKNSDADEDMLQVLSKEFDSLGLPEIDFSLPKSNRFQQVISISRMLVQLHRRVISEMKDVNINCRSKENKTDELHKRIDELKLKLKRTEERNTDLRHRILLQNEEQTKLQTKADLMKDEMDKTKRYHVSKLKEMEHNIKRLIHENKKIKEKIGDDVGTYVSRDEMTVKLLTKYKLNEEIYKNTIKKLQENNQTLLEELAILKTLGNI